MHTALQRQMIAIRDLIRAEIRSADKSDRTAGDAATADYDAHLAFVALCESFGCAEPSQ